MMKLCGFLLLLCTGYGTGEVLFRRQIHRRNVMAEGLDLLRFLQQQVQYHAPTAEALARQILQEYRWPAYIPDPTSPFPLTVPDCFTKTEAAALAQCFGGIGHQVTLQSCNTLQYYIDWLTCRMQTQEETCAQAAKLYRQLGLCAGLAGAILLL